MPNLLRATRRLFPALASYALAKLNVKILRGKELRKYERNRVASDDLDFLRVLPTDCVARALENLDHSKAQLRQDLFALSVVGFGEPGYFVEFGASDGMHLSNTWLLEKRFGWTGLLAEPARVWHRALAANRSCRIDQRCVWRSTGEIVGFDETNIAELSTISAFSKSDVHESLRTASSRYDVETVSLLDLLDGAGAPREIQYLSIDTEGSEYEILKAFDFDKYRFKVITCEHNYGENRKRVAELLSGKGYLQVHPEISRFDDWFVLATK